jgi:alkaline phosphatase D
MQKTLLILLGLLLFSSVQSQKKIKETIIALGSCGQESKPQPTLAMAASWKPDFFVFLGDNVYGDTYNMDTLQMKYQKLANQPAFQKLKGSTRLIATWDDHDYGWNDIGRHYSKKDASKNIFLNFWEEPKESPRWTRDGIYTSYYYKVESKIIQFIVLDTRTFRDDLLPYPDSLPVKRPFFYQLDYLPHSSKDSTLLGDQQWRWLENELKQPADIRIICSSTQFGAAYNGYEAWANFPHEQDKMVQLIQKTKASGVLFISGDVHYGEISKRVYPGLYPLYDVTSSGITSTWLFATPNQYRIEGPIMDNHIARLRIQWRKDPLIIMEIVDIHQNVRVEYSISLSDLNFKS